MYTNDTFNKELKTNYCRQFKFNEADIVAANDVMFIKMQSTVLLPHEISMSQNQNVKAAFARLQQKSEVTSFIHHF